MRVSPLAECAGQKDRILAETRERTACVRDADCALLVRECGSFATCGEPVRADALVALERQADGFSTECEALGGIRCLSCTAAKAQCVAGRCAVAMTPATPQEEAEGMNMEP